MSQLRLPPGPLFILACIPTLLVPISAILIIFFGPRIILGVPTPFILVDALPTWISFVLAMSIFPIAFALRIEWEQYFKLREARQHGAVLPPQISYRIPGGFDLVGEVMTNSAKHMIGYAQFEWLEAHGPMCNLRIWFTDRVSTFVDQYPRSHILRSTS